MPLLTCYPLRLVEIEDGGAGWLGDCYSGPRQCHQCDRTQEISSGNGGSLQPRLQVKPNLIGARWGIGASADIGSKAANAYRDFQREGGEL